jgi:hypothetical protein
MLAVCASCSTSPEPPLSTATFSPNPSVRSAHATKGLATISGGSYNKYTIVFSLTEGCAGEAVSSIEIDTSIASATVPLGATALRATQDTIAAAPSAYLSYMGATLVSGTVTMDGADDYFTGSLAAQVTLAGAATDVTGTFHAPLCD